MNLGEQQREKTRVAVAESREEGEKLSEIITWPKDEGIVRSGEEGEHVG